VKLLMNPMLLRMALLLFISVAAFGLGLFTIRRLRQNLVPGAESLQHSPLAAEGLPVHAYHAVIQQLNSKNMNSPPSTSPNVERPKPPTA